MYLDSLSTNKELIPLLRTTLSTWVKAITIENGQVVVTLVNKDALLPFMTTLKHSSLFSL